MTAKISRISHAYLSFPNQLSVLVGFISPVFGDREESEVSVIIEKPEVELRALSYAEIERLAIERAFALIGAVKNSTVP